MKSCVDSLNRLSKTDSVGVKKYSEDLKKYYEKMRRYYAQVVTFRRDYLQKYSREPSLPSTVSLRPHFGDYEVARKLEDKFQQFQKDIGRKSQ